MYGLTTIMGMIKCEGRTRRLAAVAMAALIFLSLTPVQTQARGIRILYKANVDYIGLAPGQTLLVAVPNFYPEDGSVKFFKYAEINVQVTDRTSNLIYSGESGGLNEAMHIFTIRYEDLKAPGEPGSIQVWIEVKLFPQESTQERAEDRSIDVLAPTVEVIDDRSGRTTVYDTVQHEYGHG